MMNSIVTISGNVHFPITLDPSVWIFDDRRIDLDEFFSSQYENVSEEEKYIEETAKHWEREIREGALNPPTLKSEKKFERQKILNTSLGIYLLPFIQNSQPKPDATTVVLKTQDKDIEIPLATIDQWIAQFSIVGKPLKEDGPIYLLKVDGTNRNTPIKNVHRIEIK
ncbi:peptidyl-prolyl cis-trans isomerase [Mangrovibacillus cuniculi]|uniref:Peptidyl-prolyl cis-trans isomerase n=1 Tax=Mangrovibacillus cuniculi TaxID=2593652 RepID=A0A7S8CA36_9BACI|nr:peptidyl-prolyl cis-trans isomerase [Mangrovibacillus cuniculi]QPC46209.1 peptidyl-prolyl cis-trans isomerase [Mangrovibacillus cuniculi]